MTSDLSNLVVCPTCDAVFKHAHLERAAHCTRCHARLSLGAGASIARVVVLALTSAVLMIVVVFAPFLALNASGVGSNASVFDVARTLQDTISWPLALAVLALTVLLPWSRLLLLIYALSPAMVGAASWPGARWCLKTALWLRPWAMAEVFMIGVAVALIKLGDLATLFIGPAFWAFAVVVLLNAYKDTQICKMALWAAVSHK